MGIRSDDITFNLLSDFWWESDSAATLGDGAAQVVATELLGIVLDLGEGFFPFEGRRPLPLRPVKVSVGDQQILLCWEADPASARSRRWFWMWGPDFEPTWLFLLLLGDPRVRLRVYPDGRADLRVQRSVWAQPSG